MGGAGGGESAGPGRRRRLIDLVVDYSERHGGPPRPDQPWLTFVLFLRQHARLEARDLLHAIEGPATAVQGFFGDSSGGEQQLRLRVLQRVAYGADTPLTT